MDPIELRDSRRLTGPSLLSTAPGAVADVGVPEERIPGLLAAWREAAARVLARLGWAAHLSERRFPGGVSLFLSAPPDRLYVATEINEWALEAALARLDGRPEPDLDEAAERLAAAAVEEANPALLELAAAAQSHGLAFLCDDDRVSVGLGAGSMTWAARELPPPGEIDWSAVHDVPVALVTGTNGKTTTVRMLTAILEAAGLTPGSTSTDGIRVGSELIEAGDYSGPGGARTALRDRRVQTAVLETARGGMLRRGLAVTRAAAAAVTNIAEDHLGEWGVHDLAALAEVKLLVDRAAERLVLNYDDPEVRRQGRSTRRPVIWFSLDPVDEELQRHLEDGGDACLLDGNRLVRHAAGEHEVLATVDEIPSTLDGAARHNIANALAAAGLAIALGLPPTAVRAGLAAFRSTATENPGRLNEFRLGGVRVLVDFAHNPHGLEALLGMAAALPARRRLVLLGQAGDRDDASVRSLARIVAGAPVDAVIVKEMQKYLRGRQAGEVPQLLEEELRREGAGRRILARTPSEAEAVRQALEWCRPGDLLLLLSHEARAAVLAFLGRLQETGWRPGVTLPEGP